MEICKKIMKFIPLFLILLFFSGALLLVYMTWETYINNRNFIGDSSSKTMMNYPIGINSFNQELDPSNRLRNPDLRMNSYDGFVPKEIISSVDEKTFLDDEGLRNLERKKMKVISNLRRHVLNGATTIGNINEYDVNFNKLKPRNNKFDPRKVMCQIKNIQIDILNHKSSTNFKYKSFPSDGLFSEYLSLNGNPIMEKETSKSQNDENTPIYRSCAVVPNSAALDGSKHGIDIDSHDFILRFNNAPTQGYEEDVGSLTSMRIINSQVITKERFLFPHSSYFESEIKEELAKLNASESNRRLQEINLSDSLWSGTRKFLSWDPCNYSASVDEWYKNPDHPIFDKYFDLTSHTEKFGKNKFYILNCRVLWNLWDLLHQYTFAKIHGTPPTSGFIGIILAMKKCERVNVYEYIPSMRESQRCHYYGPKNESNPSCTYGSWHPVSAEKLFTYNLSDGTDKEIFMDGVLSIPGVSKFKC